LTKIGVDIEICLGNKQGNFQIHRFTRRENITKSFRRATFFDSQCRYKLATNWQNFTEIHLA